MRIKLATWSLIAIIALLTQGCSTSNGGVQGSYPPKAPKATEGAAIGAAAGAAAAGLSNTNVPLGITVGALLGGAAGSYYDTQGLINQLQKQGITVVLLGDIVEVVVPNDLIFEPGGMEVQREAYSMLDQVVFLMKQYGDVQIAITGHSDVVGTNTQQVHKSYLQAQSLATYLWSHGINVERIHLFSAGSHQTAGSLRTVDGNGYNRRVDIYFWRKGLASPLKAFQTGTNADCWTSYDPSECKS